MESDAKAQRECLRTHFLFLMKHMSFDIMLLCFFYSFEDGIISTGFMEDYFASLPTKRNFNLLLLISKSGPKSFKALVQGLVFTRQKHLADMLDSEISTEFYGKRTIYSPSF